MPNWFWPEPHARPKVDASMGWTKNLAALLAVAGVLMAAEPRWRVSYLYDELDSSLTISDLKFPTPRRGLAAGVLRTGRAAKPVIISTNDGGLTWSMDKLKEQPVSLFFLNDSLGWMVTARGLWKTEESGRSWSKISSPKDVLKVYFLDPNRGFAIGARKTILETADGGKSWQAPPVAEQVSTAEANTVFATLDFLQGRFGIIAGWSRPPRPRASRFPDWMDPEAALKQRELPSSGVVLETRDGGRNWTPQVVSMFGRITQVALDPAAAALTLVEFDQGFEWPSEVFHVDLRTGKSNRVFRERDRMVTALCLDGAGNGYLAAIERQGTLRNSPIPGKLHVLRSTNLQQWRDMRVDYRAVAHRAILAAAGPAHLWAATDTGMILRLENE